MDTSYNYHIRFTCMHLVKIQLTLYSWYIMKYRHVRRPPHSVENPSRADPQWIILYWGSKWNLHTVCWGAVGCEWGTTTEAQRYHCKYNLTAMSIFLPPQDLFSPPQVLLYCREIYFNAAGFILLPQTCWWPLPDHWSVHPTSPHLCAVVWYGGINANWC